MKRSIQWAAQLEQVREVSLLGLADLDYWTQWLQTDKVVPEQNDGQAQLLIISADAKYMGLRFREISFSLLVSRPYETEIQQAAYLVAAFNSNRLFAFCERVFFSTPYLRGNIQVAAEHPVGMCLDFNGSRAFQGELNTGAANTRAPLNSEDDGWRGPVFLPPKGSRRSGPSKFFVAEIRGNTAIYPFDSTRDTYVVAPIAGISIFHALLASHFAPRQWSIREDAEHRKSKTYGIDDLDALEISV